MRSFLFPCSALRVDVVKFDPLRPDPEYIGQEHIFLPSDVFLV